jgi:hypothetical protein
MAKKAAAEENKLGRPGLTSTQIATPQGWTVRHILAELDMCSMRYFFSVLLSGDEDFQKQYASAIELRNDASVRLPPKRRPK